MTHLSGEEAGKTSWLILLTKGEFLCRLMMVSVWEAAPRDSLLSPSHLEAGCELLTFG